MAGAAVGSVYRPRGSRVAPDEDGFTMAAAAIEGFGTALPDGASDARLILAGDLPATAPDDVARFLGRSRPDPPEVVSTLAAARERLFAEPRAGPALLVVASLPSRRAEGADDPGGDVAVAVWYPEPESAPGSADGEWTTVAAFADRWSPLPRPRAEARVDGSSVPDRVLVADLPVAQGAYVPWPRYLEGVPAHWRFAAARCGACGTVTFPPRGRCRACGNSARAEPVRLDPDAGTVIASTRIGPGGQPTEFDEQVASSGPYGVVLLEFPGGVRATLQLTDSDPTRVAIGARARTRLRRTYPMDGRWRYARKAIVDPAESPGR